MRANERRRQLKTQNPYADAHGAVPVSPCPLEDKGKGTGSAPRRGKAQPRVSTLRGVSKASRFTRGKPSVPHCVYTGKAKSRFQPWVLAAQKCALKVAPA
jgi:hypothetical protein